MADEKLLKASEIIFGTAVDFLNETHGSRVITEFIYLQITGTPPSETRANISHAAFFTPQRLRFGSSNADSLREPDLAWAIFVVAMTQRQSLAALAGVHPHEVKKWLSYVSGYQFHTIIELLGKFRRNRASEFDKKEPYFLALHDSLCIGTQHCLHARGYGEVYHSVYVSGAEESVSGNNIVAHS
ncbi:hypothetical protein QBC35DRAFT_453210 [Podospora australis]|uniref:Uncharacterized protein n=1 Tax=Podospora australis TaxID=1536484 RepID=A0AAN6WS55_9PEZI|nr:hypothetical protein QBC35DRAFT_453210 [Podospora australis]